MTSGIAMVGCREPKRTGPTPPASRNSAPPAPSVTPECSPRPVFFEHLEPDREFLDGNYYALVRDSLLDTYPDRECQMISLPPFGAESATFVACKNGSFFIVLRQAAIGTLLSDKENGRDARNRHRLVERIKRKTLEYSAPISRETISLLRLLWTSMLSSVPASAPTSLGPDAAGYLFAHGGRTGCTWSPSPDSPCGRLVATATAMSELARDAPAGTDRKLVTLATELLARIPKVADERPNQSRCR